MHTSEHRHGGLNELIQVKLSKKCLAHSKDSVKITCDYCHCYYCEIKDSIWRKDIKGDVQGSGWSTKWRVELLNETGIQKEGQAWDKVLSLFFYILGLGKW